jgi:two-component system nitrogen regulation response regulator GlnG
MERLRGYPWPGNVRELQSVLKQALLHATGTVLLPKFLSLPGGPEEARAAPPVRAPDVEAFIRERLGTNSGDLYAETHRWLDQILLPLILEHTGGIQTQAASLLGVSRQTLRQRLRELGLTPTRPADQAEEEAD